MDKDHNGPHMSVEMSSYHEIVLVP
jgi:hypothetical protein